MKALPIFPILALLGGCATQTASKDPGCDAALAYLVSQSHPVTGRDIVVSAEDESSIKFYNAKQTAAEFPKGGVPAALVQRLIESGAKSALTACPAMAADLTRRNIPHQRDGTKRAPLNMDADNFQGWEVEFVLASRAVVSDDGNQALLAAGSVIGPEAGSGTIIHLRRGPDGNWRQVDEIPTWIS